MDPSRLSPEFQLLLVSARHPLLESEADRLRAACGSVTRWPIFLALAGRHNVAGIVYRNLPQHAVAQVPSEVLGQFREQAGRAQRHALALAHEQNQIAGWLHTVGLGHCPLKGPWLSQRLYGDIGWRTSGDLDMLVPEAGLELAERLLRTLFETARAANPAGTLLLNDFDMSVAYDILIEGCLAAGVPIDAIGIQSHMHQGYWGLEKTLEILDRFSPFNLPIHFSEITLVSGHLMPPEIVDLNDYRVNDWPSTPAGEERRAQEALEFYRTLFGHPLVEAITWWDFADGGWLHAPAGLVRSDSTAKSAYETLHHLVKGEWWLPRTRFTTDEAGRVQFTGFLGDYELTWEGKNLPFVLDEKGTTEVSLRY